MRFFLVACAFAVVSPVVADDVADVRKAITAQNAKYAEAINKQDVPALLALFTDDATVMYAGKTIRGKAAREKAAREQVAGVKNPRLKTTEVDVRGDLAYEVGTYTVTARDNGQTSFGTYLVVWKKQGGVWKIHVEATLPGENNTL